MGNITQCHLGKLAHVPTGQVSHTHDQQLNQEIMMIAQALKFTARHDQGAPTKLRPTQKFTTGFSFVADGFRSWIKQKLQLPTILPGNWYL